MTAIQAGTRIHAGGAGALRHQRAEPLRQRTGTQDGQNDADDAEADGDERMEIQPEPLEAAIRGGERAAEQRGGEPERDGEGQQDEATEQSVDREARRAVHEVGDVFGERDEEVYGDQPHRDGRKPSGCHDPTLLSQGILAARANCLQWRPVRPLAAVPLEGDG